MAPSRAQLSLLPVLLLLLCPFVTANVLECSGDTVEMDSNPLGTCVCDQHLWVGDNCTEGYFCIEREGKGCYKACPEGEYILPSFEGESWECVVAGFVPKDQVELFRPNVCVFPDGYNVCTGDDFTPAPTPDLPIESNPLGTCRCDGELWISYGCSFGFYCDSTKPNGGDYLSCPDGEVVTPYYDTNTWECTTDTGKCPGGEILGQGCEMRDCRYSVNPIGECKCDGQFFINDDCTTGFLCDSNIPDPYIYDGCVQYCFEDQILVPNFRYNNWECVNKPDTVRPCPGRFNLNCPEDSIDGNLTSAICECEGQLHVTSDCSEAFLCLSRFVNGGRHEVCPPGQVVVVDIPSKDFACVPDVGQCPGLGGFELGCETSSLPIPDIPCDWAANPFEGGCDGCEGQIFVSDDCSRAFYCSEFVPGGSDGYDGCLRECKDDERVQIDIANREWNCVLRTEDFTCPGALKVDCDPDFNVQCGCNHELWLNGDCSQGFWCTGPQDLSTGQNPGTFLNCPPGFHVLIDFETNAYKCSSDEGECPGSMHFGCSSEDFDDLPCIYPNTLGECRCEGQLFINDDCNAGYYCTSDIEDNLLFEGCYKNCTDGQILVPRFGENVDTWECVNAPVSDFNCPGRFNFNCPDDGVNGDFNRDICQCNNQFWLSDDCKESFYCLAYLPNGGINGSCPNENEIIEFDFEEYSYSCQPDNGQCPGLPFQFGCFDEDIDPKPIDCQWDVNPVDTCECEGQIFVEEDCTGAFYCSAYVEGEGNDGCYKQCSSDERVDIDLSTMSWDCVTRETGYECPGELYIDCEENSNPDIQCECDNQYWIYDDCTSGFKCSGSQQNNGVNPGTVLSCPDGLYLNIDFNNPSYECTSTPNQCPGSFHFGCSGDFPATDPSATSEDPNLQSTEEPPVSTEVPNQSTADPMQSTAEPTGSTDPLPSTLSTYPWSTGTTEAVPTSTADPTTPPAPVPGSATFVAENLFILLCSAAVASLYC